MKAGSRFCTFHLSHLWFGFAVERAKEVILSPVITPVPLAGPMVAGLINLRGQIVPALDLSGCLRLEGQPAAMRPVMVIVRHDNAAVGLLADEAVEVVEAPEGAWEASPGSLPAEVRPFVPGICKFPGKLLHVLDLDQILLGDGRWVQAVKV